MQRARVPMGGKRRVVVLQRDRRPGLDWHSVGSARGVITEVFPTPAAAAAALLAGGASVVVADRGRWIDVVRAARAQRPPLPVVVVSRDAGACRARLGEARLFAEVLSAPARVEDILDRLGMTDRSPSEAPPEDRWAR